MPPGTSHKKQLKAAKQTHLRKQATLAEDSDNDMNSLKDCLYIVTQQTQLLEQQLADQVKVCSGLQDDLKASQDLVSTLHTEISSLKAKMVTYIISCIWSVNAT